MGIDEKQIHELTSLFRRRSRLLTFLMTVMLAGLVAFPAIAGAAGPQFQVRLEPAPEGFERGDEGVGFIAEVENIGDEPNHAPLQLRFSLSPGLHYRATPVFPLQCTSAMPLSQVSCTSFLFSSVAPGQTLPLMGISVSVSKDAPSTATATATLEEPGSQVADASTSVDIEDRPPFGIESFEARVLDEEGSDYTVAGGHPHAGVSGFSIPSYSYFNQAEPLAKGKGVLGTRNPVEDFRYAVTDLPAGFLGNPAAVERCPLNKLAFQNGLPDCPPGSQIGVATLELNAGHYVTPIFNVVPEHGYPAEFAFQVITSDVALYPSIRPRSEGYRLSVTVPGATPFGIKVASVRLFGVPSSEANTGGPEIPFLSNPVDCRKADATSTLLIDSWPRPGRLAEGRPDLSDPNWKTATVANPQVKGCSDPDLVAQWDPRITVRPVQAGPSVTANQPSGLEVNLHFRQSNDPTDLANYIEPQKHFSPTTPQAPELKTATVALPVGMAISPSGANGLVACSDQVALPSGDQVHYDNVAPATCPDPSKIGSVMATSPLLAAHDPVTDAITGPEPVSGDIFVLAPHPGDFPVGGEGDGKYRLLIQIEDEKLGLNVKIPGVAVADKATGQLTARFIENPQFPVKDLEVEFFKGERATLSTPKVCGTYTTTTDLEAWSAPGTPDAYPQSSFELGAGSGCAPSPGARPFAPKLEAGTTGFKAGTSSPFVLSLRRGDSEQEFSSLDMTLPTGLTAKLAGVPYCPDAAIAAAKTRSGAAEQTSPSCPSASQVGTLTTSAGPGSQPYTVTGSAYLAGPYKGAPLSLAFITPAVAGPFDLGNVVVRAAAYVDPETAQVTVKTDPLPQILDGVPLGIRSIQAKIDRPGFTLNPTSCETKSISATVGGASGASASPADHFQVGDCAALAFKPKLKLSLAGVPARLGHPALKAVVTYPKGGAYSNIARAQVNLPGSELLDQANLNKTCTKPVLLAGQCPAKTVYGTARAWTPLLEKPLEGPVYLVGGYGYKLPALVAELNGQIRVVLKGKVDSGPNKGIRNTFEAVPDAPVERFELRMKGGKKYGLLINSENLCAKPQHAIARFTAQNGMVTQSKPVVSNDCGKRRKAKHKERGDGHHAGHHGRKGKRS